MHQNSRYDQGMVWAILAGVLVVIAFGLIGMSPNPPGTSIQTVAATNLGFDLGAVLVLMSGGALFWALVLFVAHFHAEHERCPDPSAHLLPRPQSFVPRQFRSVLRQIRDDLRYDKEMIEPAVQGGQMWPYSKPLRSRAWGKNKRQLDSLTDTGALYDALSVAFGHVERIRALDARRFRNRDVRPQDDLIGALQAIAKAGDALDHRMRSLDGTPDPVVTKEVVVHHRAGGTEPTVAEIQARAIENVQADMFEVIRNALVPASERDRARQQILDERVVQSADHAQPVADERHTVAAVGGTRVTCTCGRTFNTGPDFYAHQRAPS
jgi:hypothetical protein